MPQKLTGSVAREVLCLHYDQIDIAEIAQRLNLKKMQVNAIIAHSHIPRDLQGAPSDNQVDDPDEIESESVELSRSALVEQYAGPETTKAGSQQTQTAIEECDDPQQGIFIGKDKDYGDAIYWNPESTTAVPNPHMMIVG